MAEIRLVHDYMATQRRHPWKWGEHDCSLFIADWVCLLLSKDHGEKFRVYSGRRDGMRLFTELGGAPGVVALAASAAGLGTDTKPSTGDVGAIRAMSPSGATLLLPAIYIADGFWAARMLRGVTAVRADAHGFVARMP